MKLTQVLLSFLIAGRIFPSYAAPVVQSPKLEERGLRMDGTTHSEALEELEAFAAAKALLRIDIQEIEPQTEHLRFPKEDDGKVPVDGYTNDQFGGYIIANPKILRNRDIFECGCKTSVIGKQPNDLTCVLKETTDGPFHGHGQSDYEKAYQEHEDITLVRFYRQTMYFSPKKLYHKKVRVECVHPERDLLPEGELPPKVVEFKFTLRRKEADKEDKEFEVLPSSNEKSFEGNVKSQQEPMNDVQNEKQISIQSDSEQRVQVQNAETRERCCSLRVVRLPAAGGDCVKKIICGINGLELTFRKLTLRRLKVPGFAPHAQLELGFRHHYSGWWTSMIWDGSIRRSYVS
ncbi:hypothetical protein F5878DRAFT_647066 [Lentinula raphanica]|uniref:Uncharacterized protein n=1 Tax=Lentinula raphanica TaxID=153919 RepID=A0AA38NWU8_9AGAR|nr:hypothetical protein F5878DRAFT_647066 [Lentinula raphanica]